jgi:hypothetical protein
MCKLTNFQTSSFKVNLIKYHKILHKLHQRMLQAAHHLNDRCHPDTLHPGMRESGKVYCKGRWHPICTYVHCG